MSDTTAQHQEFIEDNLLIISKQTMDLFLKQEDPGRCIALYTFYYYTAKWQKTNQAKASTAYIAKSLHWKTNTVLSVKKTLISLGLITEVRQVDSKTKKVTGWYVKLNYLWRQEKSQNIPMDNVASKNDIVKSMNDINESTLSQTQGVVLGYTNALSVNNIYALSANRGEKKEEIVGNLSRWPSCPLHPTNFSLLTQKYPDNNYAELVKGHLECEEYVVSIENRRKRGFVNQKEQYFAVHDVLKAGYLFNDLDRIIPLIEKKMGKNNWDLKTLARWLDHEPKGGNAAHAQTEHRGETASANPFPRVADL